MIPLSNPDIGEREIEYVTRVMRSGRLSLGPTLEEFEKKFAAYVDARYAIATNSGTSALHLCVKSLGIGKGDEVLTSSFSFAASANCLLYEGALPSFVDIDPVTLNLDVTKLREAIEAEYVWDSARRHVLNRRSGRLLKALLPVHVFGLPCDMDKILDVANEFNLRIVEDACEAVGSSYRGQHVGTFGDAAVFAFYPNKQMTTAEGGIIVTNNSSIAELCRSLRNQGRDENALWLRHVRIGYNYRLSELHCALGVAQLERINELLAARQRVADQYSRALADIPQITPLRQSHDDAERTWFVYVIRTVGPFAPKLRDELVCGLRHRGIASQIYFEAIHRQPYFREISLAPPRSLACTEAAASTCLALPFFPTMTEQQVSEVCMAVRQSVAQFSVNIGREPNSSELAPGHKASAQAAD